MEEGTEGPSEEDDVNRVLSISSTFRDLQTAYLIISLVLSVGCGLLLIFLVWKKENLQKPSHFLRCNLAVDDIIFTSCLIPIRIVALFRQDVSGEHLWCSGRVLVAPASLPSMSGTYLLMAVDLYYFVCDPLHYHDKVTTKRVAVGILVIRAFSLFFGLAPVAFGGLPKYGLLCESDPVTSVSLSAIIRNIGTLVNFLVILFISTLYYQVFKEARRQQQRDENRDLWVFQTKAFKLMAPHAIVMTLSLATAIFQLAMARAVISEEQLSQYGLSVANHVSVLLFLSVSSVANPIIYSLRLPDFRRAIKELCGLPTNTPPAVPAQRHGDMEMAAITGSGQGAPAAEVTPAPTPTEALKPTAEDGTPDRAQKQTTQADMSPGLAPCTQHRGYRTATQRPFQLTVRADVHAEPTPRSEEDITVTLPGQL
ncbi:olfactory receptor 6M1-like [Branchiostoma floridae]|uniref:Olfactory receptor 6M1-like n=1 Tax=Branchiostoma floridae TaxID=7739 RepID=C3Z219_BRAFL|nr:olfactory receptor 6M1-like [Branchiostoma floridae]|eukprot:XP_002597524.1 hypothetical protein BRAFLDRAFT_78920 [Branchiostoma floridae]